MKSPLLSSWSLQCLPGQVYRLERFLFYITVGYAGLIFWMAPHPPMTDLPQHAGQVALLHDIASGASPWQASLKVNFFTPYLLGYGVAFLLAYAMPVITAMKLMLTLAFYGFVASFVVLRKRLDGDCRLDWFFIPSFFGFAYAWGFFTFLITAPFGILFILLAHDYACRPRYGSGIGLVVFGFLLFFSHGLIFVYANLIGFVFLFGLSKLSRSFLFSLSPYLIIGIFFSGYLFMKMHKELTAPYIYSSSAFHGGWNLQRLSSIFAIWGAADGQDTTTYIVGLLMLLAPIVLNAKINSRQSVALIPLATTLVIIMLLPHSALKNTFLYQRYSLFLLPCLALIFKAPENHQVECKLRLAKVCSKLFLPIPCWILLVIHSMRAMQFSHESADFMGVLTHVQPEQRALYLVTDTNSIAAANGNAYLHYALWYQVDYSGFVDPNFAWLIPQIVRFREDHYPAVQPNFNETGEPFDWVKHKGFLYKYFFVRSNSKPSPHLFANPQCPVALLKSVGTWSVYERLDCR